MKDGLNLMETQDAYFYISFKTTVKWYGPCYIYKDGAFVKIDYKQTTYNYAWTTKASCDPNICNPGESFSGCMRYSPGTCTPCPGPLLEGNYWSVRGQCVQTPCTTAGPGFYYNPGCGTTSNAVLTPCAKHSGNTEAAVPADSLAVAKYYCPGGEPDVLEVPDNAHVSDDYQDFICNDGYFRAGISYSQLNNCMQCDLGSYCRNGQKYQCPQYYYSAQIGQSSCQRCTLPGDCDNSVLCDLNIVDLHQEGDSICGNVPEICDAGSTHNSRCISCGTCGNWPYTGRNCILGDEMDSLPATYP